VQRAPGIPHALKGRKIHARLGRIAPRGREAVSANELLSRHRPPPGRRIAPPDDRLQRTIQYSRDVSDRAEKPRRTGYPACAEYDGVVWGGTGDRVN
jgi:hypothetical protein